MWERDENLGVEIEKAWARRNPGSDLGGLAENLKQVAFALRNWSREKFGHVNKEIEKLRKELDDLEWEDPVGNRAAICFKVKQLNEILYREEMMWLQRSRISWLKEGDRNTNFFHRKAMWRAKKNKIKKLKREDGSWCSDQGEMGSMVTDYFTTLFTADQSINFEGVVSLFQQCITEEMNKELMKPYSDEEIGDALHQIGPLKAPGPDGLPARFFQRNWVMLRKEVIEAIQNFFETGIMPDGINETKIVLIPKLAFPETLKDFRPISLCNVLYKVVSQCLVNRLWPLLDGIISPNQSAFIPGRMITDNALIAFECIHAIQNNTDGRGDYCAYKLDLSKAYDRVDSGFLKSVLLKLGFQCEWVQRIMACVMSVRYSVKVTPSFTPTRGLRQGDPLSPYLFLFVADGLSALIQDRVQNGALQEMKICRRAPGVSHLLFADDTILFFKADQHQAHQVREIVQDYERGTGQLINRAKCSILFKRKDDTTAQDQVKRILRVELDAFEPKYLGLPTPSGRMKGMQFQPLREKLQKRLSAYTEKHLSAAAKEVLIKTVAQALPTYIMGVFKLPLSICDDLTSTIRNFWWGSEKGKRKTAWIAWKELLLKKNQGGFGFKDMRLFNQAMLARQAWRLIEKPNSLCAKLLKAKYFPRCSILDSVKSANASATCQSVLHGLELLKKGIIWRIGDGSQVRIWRDPWIPWEVTLKVSSRWGRCRLHWVSDLLNSQGTDWDRDKLLRYFNEADREDYKPMTVVEGKGKKPARPPGGRSDDGRGRKDATASVTTRRGWQKPEDGWIKVNVDDAFVEQTGTAGAGVVARDMEGSVIFTAWRVLFDCASAKEAEARACLEGLRLASQWCHEPVILESDCAQMLVIAPPRANVYKEVNAILADSKQSINAIVDQRHARKKMVPNSTFSKECTTVVPSDEKNDGVVVHDDGITEPQIDMTDDALSSLSMMA
ncbi:hypothetical protein U9M48_002614 [Paspalum notatum var. saurae]|uniref:Reverse transcriptase domain-containing protein n=1 Tax=Paspalum notatum var. saurae TaxID=547442 RepID=A0AAQ3PRP3_PASNO